VKSTYRGLKKAWIGLRIAKQAGDKDKMKYYAEGIQKFEKQLNLPISSFSELGIAELTNADKAQDYTPHKSSLSIN
jgi:hypothetical protein